MNSRVVFERNNVFIYFKEYCHKKCCIRNSSFAWPRIVDALMIKKCIITNWKFLDVEYYDLVRVVEEGFHLIHDGLHGNRLEHSVIRPPHWVGVGIVSDSDVEISDSVD